MVTYGRPPQSARNNASQKQGLARGLTEPLDEEVFDDDDEFREDPEISARARSFKLFKQLLHAPKLGTS
jgi:hypothetical protein